MTASRQLVEAVRADLAARAGAVDAGASEPSRGERDVFVRKAMGWALRELSKTHADEVVHYVETHELSPLSRREALKWLEVTAAERALH